ncbi:glycosyltransferase [Winogradskyella sp. SM1960]|uniref:glycosyltransferase n=1 Tax=Winogradskyella sp. SM1960 TaxID=2865955 RepID=UPI001CD3A701|nr:glycosyltransferase [Winogradskyella sp. SM1960]
MSMLILLLGNPLNHEGGMVEFNKGLISTLNSKAKNYKLQHFSIGSRMSLFYYPILKRIVYPLLLFIDLFRLSFKLFNRDIKVLQLNPSLIPVPLIRDGVVQILNRCLFKKKTIVVLHGWKQHVFEKIMNNKLYYVLTKQFFKSADIIFVLSEEFKTKLISVGVEGSRIKVTTTFFYKDAIHELSLNKSNDSKVNFIYLGRVSKLKGVYELIKAFEIVACKYNNFVCQIVGHGDKPNTLVHYRSLIEDLQLQGKILILGRKTGIEKYKLLSLSDVYILPSYMEGCPTTAIEAMASGLFTISTDVGALDDIINDFNGIKVKPKQIIELAEGIMKSIDEIETLRARKKQIAQNALNNYEVNQIASQFHEVYSSLIS